MAEGTVVSGRDRRRAFEWAGLTALGIVVGIQVIRPARTNPPPDPGRSIEPGRAGLGGGAGPALRWPESRLRSQL